ncbi:MAG: V-type ATP synthase subunit F, partial [Nitrososphaeria archaeon]
GDETVTEFFNVVGAEKTFVPKTQKEARNIFNELIRKNDATLLIVEREVASWIEDLISKHISEKVKPLIITVQSPKKEYKESQLEDIVKLIEKVTGVKLEL